MPLISELEDIYYLKTLAANYECINGEAPFELSHWDPSPETITSLLVHLRLPQLPSAAPYIYPYYLTTHAAVLEALGFSHRNRTCLFVQSGTNAMLLAGWWLKSHLVDRIIILGPAYFPVYYIADAIGLAQIPLYMERFNGTWNLPRQEIENAIGTEFERVAVWVTNPVFCTGCYISEDDAAFIQSLHDRGCAIVADECLAMTSEQIASKLAANERFLSLHSPHKTVCLNSVKFAALVFDVKFQRFFEDWSDVLAGGLPASSYCAIAHFLSKNFAEYQSAFFRQIDKSLEKIVEILKQYDSLVLDNHPKGHFVTCYARSIPGSDGNDPEFLRSLVSESGALVIPGTRNHFNADIPFNFRLNLARASPQFYGALHRTFAFLEHH